VDKRPLPPRKNFWLPPTAGGRAVAIIALLLLALLIWVTPGYFTSYTVSACGDKSDTYGPFYEQGAIQVGLILATLAILFGLSRSTRGWQAALAMLGLIFIFVIAFTLALSHMFEGYCF